MSMLKVTETRTQDDLREAITPLNLGNYLHDLEQHAKQTGQLEDLKINYVLNKKSVQPRYELHRLHAIDCILLMHRWWIVRGSHEAFGSIHTHTVCHVLYSSTLPDRENHPLK